MMKRVSILIVFVLVFALFAQVNRVHACSPATPSPDDPTPIPYTYGDHAGSVDYVLVGTVIGGEEISGFLVEADIEVEYYLKGQGEGIVTIEGISLLNTCDRIWEVLIDREYVFFATRNETTGNLQLQRYLGRAGIDFAEEHIISDIYSEGGLAPDAYYPPPGEQIRRILQNANPWIFISGIVILIVLSASIFFIVRRRSPRKSKAKNS